MAQPKNCPFGVNTTIELKNITIKSDSKSTIVISRSTFQLTSVPVFSDVFVICLRLIVVLIPNGQFLDCAIIAFSERCEEDVVKRSSSSPPPPPHFSSSPTGATFHHEPCSLLCPPLVPIFGHLPPVSKGPFLQITYHLVQLPYKKVRLLAQHPLLHETRASCKGFVRIIGGTQKGAVLGFPI